MNGLESATWSESKVYVFREFEKINADLRAARDEIAVFRNDVSGKQAQDINQAHAKIRELTGLLEKTRNAYKVVRLKLWASSAAAGFLATIVFKLVEKFH